MRLLLRSFLLLGLLCTVLSSVSGDPASEKACAKDFEELTFSSSSSSSSFTPSQFPTPADLAAQRTRVAAIKAKFDLVLQHIRDDSATQVDLDALKEVLASIDTEYNAYPARIQNALAPVYKRLTTFIQTLIDQLTTKLAPPTTPIAPVTPAETTPAQVEPAAPGPVTLMVADDMEMEADVDAQAESSDNVDRLYEYEFDPSDSDPFESSQFGGRRGGRFSNDRFRGDRFGRRGNNFRRRRSDRFRGGRFGQQRWGGAGAGWGSGVGWGSDVGSGVGGFGFQQPISAGFGDQFGSDIGFSQQLPIQQGFEQEELEQFAVQGGAKAPQMNNPNLFSWSPQMQQPVMQQQPLPSVESGKSVRYAQPIVTYAQPIVQKLDMTPPKVQKEHLMAEAIVQPTFQVAPVQQVQAIMATAPTIQKGFGSALGLGSWGQNLQQNVQQPKQNLNLGLGQFQNQQQNLQFAGQGEMEDQFDQ